MEHIPVPPWIVESLADIYDVPLTTMHFALNEFVQWGEG